MGIRQPTGEAWLNAKALGLKTYNAGRSCIHGHDPVRYVRNRVCVGCAGARTVAMRGSGNRAKRLKAKLKHGEKVAEYFRKWALKNKEKRLEQERKRYAATSLGKKKEKRARQRDWLKEYQRRWREKNRDKIRAAQKRYAKRNSPALQAKRKRSAAVRRAREKAAAGTHTKADVLRLIRLQKKCTICKRLFSRKLKWTLDHIVPLSKGGTNDRGNLQLLCFRCNRHKQGSDPIRYMQKVGMLL